MHSHSDCENIVGLETPNPNHQHTAMDDELLGLLPEGDAETSLAWLGDHLEDFDVQFVGSDEPLSVALGEQSSGQEEDDDNVAIAGADTATAATTATTIRRARQRSDSENTRRLPYRQRQKLELASLRSRVAEMQYELRFLRSQRNARNANGQDATTKSSALDMSALPWALDNARPDGNGSTGGSVWQTLAKLQLQARAFAEQENANLKQALREQLEMSKELERILLRNHSLHSVRCVAALLATWQFTDEQDCDNRMPSRCDRFFHAPRAGTRVKRISSCWFMSSPLRPPGPWLWPIQWTRAPSS